MSKIKLPLTSSLASLRVLQVSAGVIAAASVAGSMSGCIEDPDCGICDPDKLVLETISGNNYAGKRIFDVSPECVGDACPVFRTPGLSGTGARSAGPCGGRRKRGCCRAEPPPASRPGVSREPDS